jgi:hypothetical protein
VRELGQVRGCKAPYAHGRSVALQFAQISHQRAGADLQPEFEPLVGPAVLDDLSG